MTHENPHIPGDWDTISLPFIFVPDGAPVPDVSQIFREPIVLRARFVPEERSTDFVPARPASNPTSSEAVFDPPPIQLALGPQAENRAAAAHQALPLQGEASTYADIFDNRPTASGRPYHHNGFSAALLPRSRRNAVPWGTRLRLTYQGRSVAVEVNDWGAGNRKDDRVLDLSRAAMAFLKGVSSDSITDRTAGVIRLERIEIVPPGTPLGPWIPSR